MERPRPQVGTQGDVLFARISAAIIDFILIAVLAGIVGGVFGAIGGRIGGALSSLAGAIVFFGYFIYLEGTYGQTLGKQVLNIVVIKDDGSDCDYGAATIRNLLRIVDNIPGFYLLGILVILLTDDNQRIGDLAGSTLVVRTV